MQSKVIIAALFAGIAAAQLSDIPPCALACVSQATAMSSCQLTDYKCQCTTDQAKITAALTPCVCKSTCTADQQAQLVKALNGICAAAVPGYKPAEAQPCPGSGSSMMSSSAPASETKSMESSMASSAATSAMETSSMASGSAMPSTSAMETGSMMSSASAMPSGSGMSASGSAPAASSSAPANAGVIPGMDKAILGLAGLAAFAL